MEFLEGKKSKIIAVTIFVPMTAIVLMLLSIPLFWMPSVSEPSYEFVSTWGHIGTNAGEFRDPTGLVVSGQELFVSDSRNARVQVFDLDGRFLREFNGTGEKESTLKRPMNLALSNDRLYVADYWLDRIFVFTLDGELVRMIGEPGNGPGQFNAPGGVAIAVNGDLYVADFYNQRVQQLTAEGEFVRQWGVTGQKSILNGEFNYPTDVAVSRDGKLFVADGYNDRIQVFSAAGGFMTKWGGPFGLNIKGSFNGWFHTVSSIEVDDNNYVYTADFYNNRVQKFTADGDFVNVFGESGDAEHQFDRVVAIAVSDDGTVFVSDYGHNRIQKWRPSPSSSRWEFVLFE